jgi:hypothetical protein
MPEQDHWDMHRSQLHQVGARLRAAVGLALARIQRGSTTCPNIPATK